MLYLYEGETLRSNLSRIVITIWLFVVLILTSNYTASLTSMLTVQKFIPTVSDINELKSSGAKIGYLHDSFTKGLLLKLGFDESNLKPVKSPQQYQEVLANGTVSAIVDEIPYLSVFLKNYCNNYIMTGTIHKTGGFGFAFPKGSPLVADLSKAILNLTESDKMSEIEKAWFQDQSTCLTEGSNNLSSDTTSLHFENFWGLFLLTGAVTLFCFLFCLISSSFKNRRTIMHIASLGTSSLRHRFSSVAKRFSDYNKEDSSSKPNDNDISPPHGYTLESPTSMSQCTFEGGSPLSEIEIVGEQHV